MKRLLLDKSHDSQSEGSSLAQMCMCMIPCFRTFLSYFCHVLENNWVPKFLPRVYPSCREGSGKAIKGLKGKKLMLTK